MDKRAYDILEDPTIPVGWAVTLGFLAHRVSTHLQHRHPSPGLPEWPSVACRHNLHGAIVAQ